MAIFGQSIFYLACFNCDLILIEHRNKRIVTFFGQLVHTVIFSQVIDLLGAKWY